MSTTPRILRPTGAGRYVLLCDHASNIVPEELDGLGLAPSDLARHIGWDIGAAGITALLSEMLDAPAVLSAVSRLVIDCNRHPGAADLIPAISDGTRIPGNQSLNEADRAARIHAWFTPYHDAVESVLQARESSAAVPTTIVSVHTMTPSLNGVPRPWQIAVSSAADRSLADPLLAALKQPGDVEVGDNQPYDLDAAVDFSVPFHAWRRGWPHVQVEFRQDEVADAAGQLLWARRFAQALMDLPIPASEPVAFARHVQ